MTNIFESGDYYDPSVDRYMEFLFSSGGLTPTISDNVGNFIVTFYTDDTFSTVVDMLNITNAFYPMPGSLGVVLLSKSSDETYNGPTDYKFEVTLDKDIFENSLLKIIFPSEMELYGS